MATTTHIATDQASFNRIHNSNESLADTWFPGPIRVCL